MTTRRLTSLTAIVLGLVLAMAPTVRSQTYKVDFTTAIKMASGGTDISKLFTITAPAGMSTPLAWVLPPSNGTSGYILGTDGAGNLSWVNPATSVALVGDVTGTAGANTVAKINGATLGDMTSVADGNLLIYNSGSWNPTGLSGDISITGAGATAVNTYNGGTTFGTMAHQDYNNVGISGGNINGTVIGDTLAAAGTFTNLTATGTVTLPAGSVTAASLGLTDGKILIGDGTNYAAEQTLSQDVSITNTGVASVNSVRTGAGASIADAINTLSTNAINGDNIKHDATLAVSSNNLGINLSNPNTWTGTQTFGATAYTGSTLALSGGVVNDIAASNANSVVQLNPSAADSVTSIASPAAGRMMVLMNIGSYPVTLVHDAATGTAANRVSIPGGYNVILGPGGSVTLLYDSGISRWRMINY